MLTAADPITWNPQRVTVAGVSGSGKTTLCDRLAALLNSPRIEIDSLYHGPGWTPRESFVAEVEEFTAGHRWVIELQYRQVRPTIVARADTLLWLDYPTRVSTRRLVTRTLSRRLLRRELWNGNQEPPLRTIVHNRDHILRWGWRTRHSLESAIPSVAARSDHLTVVRLTHPRDTHHWVRSLERTR